MGRGAETAVDVDHAVCAVHEEAAAIGADGPPDALKKILLYGSADGPLDGDGHQLTGHVADVEQGARLPLQRMVEGHHDHIAGPGRAGHLVPGARTDRRVFQTAGVIQQVAQCDVALRRIGPFFDVVADAIVKVNKAVTNGRAGQQRVQSLGHGPSGYELVRSALTPIALDLDFAAVNNKQRRPCGLLGPGDCCL